MPCMGHISISTDQGKCLASLDVCSSSGAATSVNADLPFLVESPGEPAPMAVAEYMGPESFFFIPSLFVIRTERPPEI
jgi:hypothetical protein